jgi:hypothetical protein
MSVNFASSCENLRRIDCRAQEEIINEETGIRILVDGEHYQGKRGHDTQSRLRRVSSVGATPQDVASPTVHHLPAALVSPTSIVSSNWLENPLPVPARRCL